LAINADLPIPNLPSMAGRIGVPATEAGRPIPPGARRVGTGWNARGMISSCRPAGLGELAGPMSTTTKTLLAVGLVVAALGAAFLISRKKSAAPSSYKQNGRRRTRRQKARATANPTKHWPFKRKAKLGPGPMKQRNARTDFWDCLCDEYVCTCKGEGGQNKHFRIDPKVKARYNKIYRAWKKSQRKAA
jgi:hypothetical protein